jgi:hypothetical protein
MSKVLLATLGVAALLTTTSVGLAATAAADTWTMPNLVGIDLQGAQDAMQSLTDDEVWYSGSTDLTGKGRMQIDDRNWVVCTSTPAAGVKFNQNTKVNFGVVRKSSESCP